MIVQRIIRDAAKCLRSPLSLGLAAMFALDLGPATVPADATAPAPAPAAPAPAPSTSLVPSFFTTTTRLWSLRPQIVCFQVSQPAAQDTAFPFNVDDKFLRILLPPRVLAGRTIGYVRLQPLAVGTTQLELGGARLRIEVVADPAAPRMAAFAPRIVSPASGADVWGDFSVGVEQMTLGDPAKLAMPVLRLASGRAITGHVVPDQEITQYGRWVYDLTAADLASGANKLVATGQDIDGHDLASEEIKVNLVTPDPTASFIGFCRDQNAGDRPYKTGNGPPSLVDDTEGHGKVIEGRGGAWCLPVWIEKPGVYQMILTVRGRIGGDGLPTVGLSTDETGAQNAITVRLATTEWRRVPVGHPIVLMPGGHIINVRMDNQFKQGKDDYRSTWLDQYELTRINPPNGQLAANSADTTDPTLPMTGEAPKSMMEEVAQAAHDDVHVVFADNIDGKTVAGPLDFNAQCWWPGQTKKAPAPKVELYVNRKLVSTRDGAHPHFTVDPSAFIAGTNTLRLRALLPSGMEAKSTELSVEVPADFPLSNSGAAALPVIAISYAPTEIGAGKADAVVASVMDSRAALTADLVIDDQPQHLDLTPAHGLGPLLFPVLSRDLQPGSHRLKVVARDAAGNQAASPETTFTIVASSPTLSRYERAVFLLNRFAYGPEPDELAAILTEGETPWLTRQLTQGPLSPGEQNAQDRVRAENASNRGDSLVTNSVLGYLLTAPNPVRARFLMWTENHFSTWLRKEGFTSKGEEHEAFLRLGPAPFFDLLFTSATSPAMLFYLDQVQSFANKLNENYAREIMELHTLGVKGGYTQTDVTTMANLLTGWTLVGEAPMDGSGGGQLDRVFGYDPNLNNGKECRIFGLDFPAVTPDKRFDRVLMMLEMLSAHPSCATFVSRRLCEEYVADPAPPELVQAMAQTYLETGGDLSAVLVTMSRHPAFWAAPAKVATPIDFAIRSSRLAGRTDPAPVLRFVTSTGMGIFDRATPDGYPQDDGYSMSTNALLQRWKFSQNIQNDFLHAGLIPAAWRPATDTAWDPGLTQRMIDLASVRITGNLLGTSSNEAAQKLLADSPATADERLHLLATFICQVPENNLK